MSIWVLTEEYNDYDLHGEYFVHAWSHKPTREELLGNGVPETSPYCPDLPAHVLNGGGRITYMAYYDEQWYHLKELK